MCNQISSLVQKCSCNCRNVETLCLVLHDIALYYVERLCIIGVISFSIQILALN
jgi:hypothetical protein